MSAKTRRVYSVDGGRVVDLTLRNRERILRDTLRDRMTTRLARYTGQIVTPNLRGVIIEEAAAEVAAFADERGLELRRR